jgi:hypothetical protein
MQATSSVSAQPDSAVEGRWVHPLCTPLALDRSGPFLDGPDGRVLSATADALQVSADEGQTWSDVASACHGQHPREPGSFYLVRAQDGALVMVYLDLANYRFSWDDEAGEAKDDCHLELRAVRSLDGGKTWVDRQTLLDGYNANFFGFIRLRNGRLVVVAEHLASQPGRWVVCSFTSADHGHSWERSNLIDLGGRGHHDGAIEPTVAELSDGRLLMLIRTNLERFWQAFSEDGGRTWRTIQPSALDASSAPGFLLRLQSGRLLLVWNRLHPEGGTWPRSQPGPAAEVAASWHREELSAALSADDGRSWTQALVLARQQGGQLSYPYAFERRPGELWITAGFAFRKGWENPVPLRLGLREDELLAAAVTASCH